MPAVLILAPIGIRETVPLQEAARKEFAGRKLSIFRQSLNRSVRTVGCIQNLARNSHGISSSTDQFRTGFEKGQGYQQVCRIVCDQTFKQLLVRRDHRHRADGSA